MRKLFLFKFLLASLFALITLAVGTVAHDWRAKGPVHVEGVRLRATETEALSLLGSPVTAEDVPDDGDPMGIGKRRDLTYPGLRLELARAPGSAEFRVVRMIVTDASRRVSIGIKPGDTKAQALAVLGEADGTPPPDDAGNPGAVWLPGNDDHLVLYFAGDRVIAIIVEEDLS